MDFAGYRRDARNSIRGNPQSVRVHQRLRLAAGLCAQERAQVLAAHGKEAEKRARERYREIEKRAERYRDGGTGFPAPSLLGFFDQFEAEVDRPTPSSGAQGGNKSEPLAYYHLTNYSSANDN